MRLRLYESLRAVFYTPYYVALARGGHERAGLDVVLSRPETSDRTARDLFEGKADLAWGGPMRMMQLMNADPDPERRLIAFGEAVTRDPFFLIGAKPRPDFRLEDLPGLRVATVSEVPTPWMCLQEDLRRAGVDPGSLDRVAERTMAENAAALRRGEVDAIQVFEPFAEELIREGAGAIWRAGAARGPTSYTTYYAPVAFVRENREALVRLVAVLHEALVWLQAAAPEAVAEVVQPYFPDVPPGVLAGAIGRYKSYGVWGRNPRLPLVGFVRLKVSLISGGFIDRDIAFDDCVDNVIAEAAMRPEERA